VDARVGCRTLSSKFGNLNSRYVLATIDLAMKCGSLIQVSRIISGCVSS
jgi:hypothetical protein